MFGLPGYVELLIVGAIVLLLFGNRLPGVMGSLGKSIVEFKKGVKGIQEEINSAEDSDQAAASETEPPPKEKETVPPE